MSPRPVRTTAARPRRRALAALQDLCALGLAPEVLVPAVLEALHDLIPSQRNLFDWTDDQGQLLRYFIEGPIDTRIAKLYFDEFHNRREAEAMPPFSALRQMPGGVRSAQELLHSAFYRSALYHEIWRPQGLHTRLEAVLRSRTGRLLGSLVLYRGCADPVFTSDDERWLGLVLPALAHALGRPEAPRAALAPEERHLPGPDAPETLLMTLDGALLHASPGAHRLLLMAEGGATRDRLSQPVGQLASGLLRAMLAHLRGRASSAPAAVLAPPPRICHAAEGGHFMASGELLRPVNGQSSEALAQVSLRRLEPHRVALERVLRRLPITTGQMAVARHLYHGHSQARIGRELGVAPATVVDHVRKVYRALDLGSALELRAALDARLPQL